MSAERRTTRFRLTSPAMVLTLSTSCSVRSRCAPSTFRWPDLPQHANTSAENCSSRDGTVAAPGCTCHSRPCQQDSPCDGEDSEHSTLLESRRCYLHPDQHPSLVCQHRASPRRGALERCVGLVTEYPCIGQFIDPMG